MATSIPRQKLFGSSSTSSFSSLFFLAFFLGSTLFLWLVSILGSKSAIYVSGEVPLDPDLLKEAGTGINERVPRSIIPLDGDFSGFGDSYNNPKVIEGEGRSGGGDAYESLRQLGLASTQSFIRRRLFNTSVALTVPLFSFTLPQRAAEGSTVDLANQAIFGLFALLTTMLVFAVPVLFTGIRPFDIDGRSLKENNTNSAQNILEHLMSPNSHVVNLMGTDMRNKIGLNPDQCLQKTICDAHRNPKKYGLFALPFHIFFPPPPVGKEPKEGSRSYSKYQEAAGTGEFRKGECWSKYNCFFDLMDLAIYLVDWFNPPSTNHEESDNFDYDNAAA